MNYLFTSESVSEGHPDKVADQISDAIVDKLLAYDPQSKVACETLVTTGQVVIAGEVKSEVYIDLMDTTRRVINEIGYNKSEYKFDGESCGVLNAIHEQSADINRGVERENADEQGAGDQGMMFGYACNETENYMPLTLDLAHAILRELSAIRREHKEMTYLRPDSKSQVTVEYDEHNHPVRVHTIVVSTQHDDFIAAGDSSKAAQDKADSEMLATIYNDVKTILLPRVIAKLPERIRAMFDDRLILHVNPTGKFVIGGPHGDTGLTGRKIIVDTYGGRGAHGGGETRVCLAEGGQEHSFARGIRRGRASRDADRAGRRVDACRDADECGRHKHPLALHTGRSVRQSLCSLDAFRPSACRRRVARLGRGRDLTNS